MGKYELVSDKEKFRRHKKYRWIALAFKLVARPLLGIGLVAIGLGKVNINFRSGAQPLSTFFATFLSLLIYYGIIFILNRKLNFNEKGDLKKSIAVYTLAVILMMMVESFASPFLQNYLYGLTKIDINTSKGVFAYGGIGLLIQFLFSMITGRLIFLLYKKVLSNPQLLDRI